MTVMLDYANYMSLKILLSAAMCFLPNDRCKPCIIEVNRIFLCMLIVFLSQGTCHGFCGILCGQYSQKGISTGGRHTYSIK